MVGEASICPLIVTHIAVTKEKKENFEVRAQKKSLIELDYNYYHIGINLLTTCLPRVIQHLLVRKGCSIFKIMAERYSIKRIIIEDDLHSFATKYLCLKRKKEICVSMGDLEKKLNSYTKCMSEVKKLRWRGTSCFLMHDVISS